ncbi:MAG TPA: class I adenylate-forming enzyme family protein [Parvularculaceae bacterium]|nr:class I adenylate-forming enzyme family protein [Parvularculaceae bacterium]
MTQAAAVDPMKVFAAAARILAEEPMFAVGEADIRGNTYRVFKNAPPSLVGIFLFGTQFADKDFLIYEDERLTFAETWERACRFANALARDFKIGKGDKVAIAMRNFPEWCISYMAIISLGAVVVPLNAWWKNEELHYGLADCGAKLVIVDDKRMERILPCKKDLGLTLILARGGGEGADHHYEDLLESCWDASVPSVDIQPEDDFCIVYTSGSTGNSKGVILTHRGVVSTLLSWAFVASALKEARGGESLFGDNPGILLAVPLFHVTGSHSLFLMSMLIGRRVVMMYKWDPKKAVELINHHQLTNFVGVPSQSYELVDAAGDTSMPSLLDIGSGGAKRPPEHVKLLKKKFPNANPASGYGLSETNALGCIISLDDYQKHPDSTGRPVPPVTDIKIMMEEGEAQTGEVGEIWIRSPANFRGYLNLPEETAKSLTPDGWFKSGDLGRFDEEGFLYIVDRTKDVIIRGGENISSLEVEHRAHEFPGVAEVAAFSVPDEVLGERVGLVVYPKPGATVEPLALRDFIAAELAEFKVPERIWISPVPLPRLGTEKFDKRTVRMIALQHPPAYSA